MASSEPTIHAHTAHVVAAHGDGAHAPAHVDGAHHAPAHAAPAAHAHDSDGAHALHGAHKEPEASV